MWKIFFNLIVKPIHQVAPQGRSSSLKPKTSSSISFSPGVIGFNLEQISNKLKISGSVQKMPWITYQKSPRIPLVAMLKFKMAAKMAAVFNFYHIWGLRCDKMQNRVSKCKFFDMRNAMGSLIFCLNDDLAWYWCYGDILVHNFFLMEILECLVINFTLDHRSKDNRMCSLVKPKNVSRLVLKFCFT